METAYFDDIRQQILKELAKSQSSINVAVAWFTNHNLFDMLCNKIKEGEKEMIFGAMLTSI